MSVNAEKVFDSVSWNFLYRVLHRFGLHDTIIKTIQSLYESPTARIKVNGYLSNSITLQREVQDKAVHGHHYSLHCM